MGGMVLQNWFNLSLFIFLLCTCMFIFDPAITDYSAAGQVFGTFFWGLGATEYGVQSNTSYSLCMSTLVRNTPFALEGGPKVTLSGPSA